MSHYRRAAIAGASYFFTVVTYGRRPLFTSPENVQMLRTALRRVRTQHPFHIDAMVVLPDHLHAIWTLPDGEQDFSQRWRLIKSTFTRNIPRPHGAALRSAGESKVWQRRYWEHLIRDEDDYQRHMDYIHYNPVKHGLATRPLDWPYSSFRRAMERGEYSTDWGIEIPDSIQGMDVE